MKQSLKNQKGIAFIAVILIIIVAVAAGGATYLGVRMVITGEDFLAPFEELGWIDSDNKKDKDDADDDEKGSSNKKESSIEVSSKAKKSGVTHYELDVDLDKVVDIIEAGLSMYSSFSNSSYDDMDSDDVEEYEKIIKKIDFSADLYAKSDEIVEIDVYLAFKDALKEAYNYAVENSIDLGLDELDDLDEYDSFDDFYKEFEKEYLKEYVNTNYIVELITDEIDLSDFGIKSSDIEKALSVKSSNGTISIQFEVPDDMNESIKEAIEDNIDEINDELSEELNSIGVNVEIDPDTYVEDIIKLAENIIDEYGDLLSSYNKDLGKAVKGVITINKVK